MIVLVPIESGATCEELLVIQPNVPLHEGCPVLTKTRSVTVAQGQAATVSWNIVDREGDNANITTCVFDGDELTGDILVRIKDALGSCSDVTEVTEVTLVNAATGEIRFDIPESIANKSCLYMFEIAVKNSAGRIVVTNRGILSVEPGLFGDSESCSCGGITLEEIRMQLRDILAENDLNEDVEFDDSDILHSILQPIRFWNEIPPDVARFNACNFPYRNAWLRGTCANLLRIAATWYERNNLQSAHGGVQLNDRAKSNGYLVLSKSYEEEWREFVERKKIEINAADCYGSV